MKLGTKEQLDNLDAVIEKYRDTQGALIPILHEAQDIYGYLPADVELYISEKMNIPLSEIYGVVTFYTGFSTEPKGKYKINICLGTACYVRGADKLIRDFQEQLGIDVGECTDDMKFSLDTCRCVGACGLAPVVMINDDVYGNVQPTEVKGILANYEDK